MSRWYDQHRIVKRMRRLELAQFCGAAVVERAVEHLLRNDQEMREYLVQNSALKEPPRAP